jgi:hypothetical protein
LIRASTDPSVRGEEERAEKGRREMRATLMLGILGATLSVVCSADAQSRSMSRAERAGYDYGWDDANDFCKDLRPRGRSGHERRDVTREFSRGCKKGFDDHINSNRTCSQRIRRQNAYTEMWSARRSACD